MAWNEPGNSGGKSPWGGNGGGNNNQEPPDLDEILKNLNDKFSKIFGGNKKGGSNNNVSDIGGKPSGGGEINKALLIIPVIIAAIIWVLAGIYTVDQGKQAVILQLGAYYDTQDAGLHWHAPILQEYYIVDVSAIQSLNLGDRESEALMLTKDENIVDIKMTVQFRIQEPEKFLFNVKEPGLVLKQVTESAIREVIGRNNMDYIITGGRSEIAQRVQSLSQEILDRYQSGLIITNFVLRDAQPPEQVQHAFDDAVKAREDKQKYVNQSETYRNEILPTARGNAAKQIAEAEAYSEKVISEAEGEASRFTSVLKEYSLAKDVTRDRLYIDAMESVLSSTNKVLIDNKSSNSLMYLPLDKLISGERRSNITTIENSIPAEVNKRNAMDTPISNFSQDLLQNNRQANSSRLRETRERR